MRILVVMTEFDPSAHCLSASEDDKPVGLILKKPVQSDHVFKVPTARVSLLGLDKLAAEKRKRQHETKTTVEEKKTKTEDYDDLSRVSFGRSGRKERNYRATANETPSHPGGVSSEALKRIQDRQGHGKGKGVFASSQQRKSGSNSGSSSRRDDDSYRDRRKHISDSSSHHRDERHSDRDEWEETPSLSRGITVLIICESVYSIFNIIINTSIGMHVI